MKSRVFILRIFLAMLRVFAVGLNAHSFRSPRQRARRNRRDAAEQVCCVRVRSFVAADMRVPLCRTLWDRQRAVWLIGPRKSRAAYTLAQAQVVLVFLRQTQFWVQVLCYLKLPILLKSGKQRHPARLNYGMICIGLRQLIDILGILPTLAPRWK